MLSGVCDTKEQAEGNLQFIKDCRITENPHLVIVRPNGIERLEK